MREYELEQQAQKIQKKNKNWLREIDTKHRNRKTSYDIDEMVQPHREGETDRQRRWRERKEQYNGNVKVQGQTDC